MKVFSLKLLFLFSFSFFICSKRKAKWKLAKFGGGGFVTGADVSSDGTKVFRTDTSGAYLYDDSNERFVQIVPANLPDTANIHWNGDGAFEALISYTDSDILYVAYSNRIWKSSNKGKSFVLVKSELSFEANGGAMRTRHRHGDIDPNNPDHVIFGHEDGMIRTTDGGVTWEDITTLPAPGTLSGGNSGWSGVAFDKNSDLIDGLTSIAIVSTEGRFFRTTDAGVTWTEISNGEPNAPGMEPMSAEFDESGRYFVGSDGMWRYEDGTWYNLPVPNAFINSILIDPDEEGHIITTRGGALNFAHSYDNGDTWTDANWAGQNLESVDNIPWHDTIAGEGDYFHNNAIVDPKRKVAWFCGGNKGIVSAPLSVFIAGEIITMQAHGEGIGQICANQLVTPPGSKKLHAALWDEYYAILDRDNEVYPSLVNDVGSLGNSFGLDYSKEDPKYLARWLSSGDILESGWSDDEGETWNPFTTLPADTTSIDQWGAAATVAYSGIDNIILVSSNTNNNCSADGHFRIPYYTLDRGENWYPVELGNLGVTCSPSAQRKVTLINLALYLNRIVLAADPEVLGRFWLLVSSDDSDFAGMYKTEDGGVTWERTAPLFPEGVGIWSWNAHIESPVTNHIWASGGGQSPNGEIGIGGLYYSTDGGYNFIRMPGVREASKFGFGAPKKKGGYPILFLEGYVNGEPGMYMCTNAIDYDNITWINLGKFANDQPHSPRFIAGDPDVPGRVWVAKGCAGIHFGDFKDLLFKRDEELDIALIIGLSVGGCIIVCLIFALNVGLICYGVQKKKNSTALIKSEIESSVDGGLSKVELQEETVSCK